MFFKKRRGADKKAVSLLSQGPAHAHCSFSRSKKNRLKRKIVLEKKYLRKKLKLSVIEILNQVT